MKWEITSEWCVLDEMKKWKTGDCVWEELMKQEIWDNDKFVFLNCEFT
jgi:hypothetical protein